MCGGDRQGAALLAKHVHVSNRTAYSQVRIERESERERGYEWIERSDTRPCAKAVYWSCVSSNTAGARCAASFLFGT